MTDDWFPEMLTTVQGWAAAPAPPEAIEEARRRFAERNLELQQAGVDTDALEHRIPSGMNEADEEHRWTGDLGEMMVEQYLRWRAYTFAHLALVKETRYDPDFRINNHLIDVKTKNRKNAPKYQDDYFETINHDQWVLTEPKGIMGFIFCDYAYEDQWIYLTGKISRALFDQLKIERNIGDQPHAKFTVMYKSWDVSITKLTPPLKWQKAA